MKDTLRIQVGGSLADDLADFVSAWRRVEAGERVEPERTLAFESWGALASTLSPARFALLQDLGREPAISINSLAKRLDRPYRRVHDDVMALVAAGLIARTDTALTLAVECAHAQVRFKR